MAAMETESYQTIISAILTTNPNAFGRSKSYDDFEEKTCSASAILTTDPSQFGPARVVSAPSTPAACGPTTPAAAGPTEVEEPFCSTLSVSALLTTTPHQLGPVRSSHEADPTLGRTKSLPLLSGPPEEYVPSPSHRLGNTSAGLLRTASESVILQFNEHLTEIKEDTAQELRVTDGYVQGRAYAKQLPAEQLDSLRDHLLREVSSIASRKLLTEHFDEDDIFESSDDSDIEDAMSLGAGESDIEDVDVGCDSDFDNYSASETESDADSPNRSGSGTSSSPGNRPALERSHSWDGRLGSMVEGDQSADFALSRGNSLRAGSGSKRRSLRSSPKGELMDQIDHTITTNERSEPGVARASSDAALQELVNGHKFGIISSTGFSSQTSIPLLSPTSKNPGGLLEGRIVYNDANSVSSDKSGSKTRPMIMESGRMIERLSQVRVEKRDTLRELANMKEEVREAFEAVREMQDDVKAMLAERSELREMVKDKYLEHDSKLLHLENIRGQLRDLLLPHDSIDIPRSIKDGFKSFSSTARQYFVAPDGPVMLVSSEHSSNSVMRWKFTVRESSLWGVMVVPESKIINRKYYKSSQACGWKTPDLVAPAGLRTLDMHDKWVEVLFYPSEKQLYLHCEGRYSKTPRSQDPCLTWTLSSITLPRLSDS